MKTFKDFRENVQIQEAAKCSECGCDPKNPKEGCDCNHKNMSEAPENEVSEEVEEIEEISKKTLGSYIKKATTSYGTRSRLGKDFERDSEQGSATNRKTSGELADIYKTAASKRKAGIMKATDRLVNKKKDD